MKKFLVVLLVISLVGCLSGCGAKETIGDLKDELKEDVAMEQPAEEQNSSENQLEVPSIDDITIEETYQPVPTMANDANQMTVKVFYASADGQSLIEQEKVIPKVEGIARATIETLLEGPSADSGLLSAVPAGTQLLDINVKSDEGLCIVDFSQELVSPLDNKGVSEKATVYAITNTLCQFDTIDKVEFRVEGQAVSTLSGETDLSQAVSANSSLVQEK